MSGISVLEYLGQNVESDVPVKPTKMGDCPFADRKCKKIVSKNTKTPVCSVRASSGKVYIVCSERLCSSYGKKLTEHQRDVLYQTAKAVFGDIRYDDVAYKKEVPFKINGRKRARADFILTDQLRSSSTDVHKVVVEFQGGG